MSSGCRLTLGMCLAGLLAAVVAISGCGPAAGQARSSERASLAVVLAPTRAATQLVVVDTSRHRIVRRVRLRSLATSMDVDERTGLVVAAQTGGIGEKADDAVSIIDPETGEVRYVTLPVRDPANVVCVGGRAYVLHSIVTSAGLLVTVVDVATGRVVNSGSVPDGPGTWGRTEDAVWTGAFDASGALTLERVDTATLRPARCDTPFPVIAGLLQLGNELVVLGGETSEAPGASSAGVALIDAASGAVTASATVPFGRPATLAAAVVERLVIGDWSGQPPESGELVVLDRRTLAARGRIAIDGVPCALAATGGHLLVVERTRGELLSVDSASGRTEWSVTLGTGELPMAALAVPAKLR